MKILKKGKKFVAYRDSNDTDLDNRINVGDSVGQIMIDSEKFTGNTMALIPLTKHLEKYKQKVAH